MQIKGIPFGYNMKKKVIYYIDENIHKEYMALFKGIKGECASIDIENYMRNEVEGRKIQECDICGNEFKAKGMIQIREEGRLSGVKVYYRCLKCYDNKQKCSVCGKEFDRDSMVKTVSKKGDVTYQCNDCI